jgi:hypothetical protein
MNEAEIRNRVEALLTTASDEHIRGHELFQGTLTLLEIVHGPDSIHVRTLTKESEQIRERYAARHVADWLGVMAKGALINLRGELDAGILGSLQRTITGEVLTDFIRLARLALDETGDQAKNVAAVLAASVYEDTLRRLAISNGILQTDRLADVLVELKQKGLLQGSQVGIAQSYLNFRNNALHAQWDKIEREAVASVLGFVEQMLLKYF